MFFSYTKNITRPPLLIKTFTVDAGNSSGIFHCNNTELAQIKVPLHYSLKGSMQVHNTTRIFFENDSYIWEENKSQSAIWVCFDGFKYNESTGFIFDPLFIFNNGRSPNYRPSGSSIGIQGAIFFIAIALAGVSVVVMRKRRSPTIGKLLPFF
jgi:hypothetical protein